MNVDNIEIAGAPTERALLDVVTAVAKPREVDTSTPGSTRLVLDDSTALYVDFDPTDDDWPGLVSVASSGSVASRQARARTVFDDLARRTPWALQLTSEDSTDVLASRTAPAHPA